jgi:hopanoid biosynthesis associated radical SAM protein HpnH
VYLCTNALLLEKHLSRFTPSKYLSFSVHLDGPAEEHDLAVCRDGTYDIAIRAIQAAIKAGFRVTTNSTLFNNANPERYPEFFDTLMKLGVEGMMVSPGYPYEKAPDQEHFLHARETVSLFRRLLGRAKRSWRFNQSPLFIEFLKGNWQLECTPWGSPAYNIFGWQKPCYLLNEGYASSFRELMESTEWSRYGRASGNSKCTDCMVHCGYEPSAVADTFGSLRGLLTVARIVLFGASRSKEPSPHEEPCPPVTPPHFTQSTGSTWVELDVLD